MIIPYDVFIILQWLWTSWRWLKYNALFTPQQQQQHSIPSILIPEVHNQKSLLTLSSQFDSVGLVIVDSIIHRLITNITAQLFYLPV